MEEAVRGGGGQWPGQGQVGTKPTEGGVCTQRGRDGGDSPSAAFTGHFPRPLPRKPGQGQSQAGPPSSLQNI